MKTALRLDEWRSVAFEAPSLPAAFLALVAACLLAPAAAEASFLSPGGSAFAPTAYGAGALPGTFIAEILPLPVVSAAGYSGTLNSIVAVDGGSGFLMFLYQVTNSGGSTDPLDQARFFDFDGIGSAGGGANILDVGFIDGVTLAAAGITGAPVKPVGTEDPTFFSRTSNGKRVTAEFTLQNIDPGETSSWLVIRTDAAVGSQVIGAGSVVDTLQSNFVSIFAPVPEPTTALTGIALTLTCAAGRRRRARGVPGLGGTR